MTTTAKRNRGPSAGPANRRALLTAAREVFAEVGYGAPLSAIARRAGVGQGSLYRHFPDRLALAAAVFDENVTELEDHADTPDANLHTLFDLITEQAIAATALIDLVMSERHDPRVAPLRTRITRVADTVLARDRAAGQVAAHVTAADVVIAISMLASVLARSEPAERHDAARRARQILETGLAPPHDHEH